jgi:hypothetical protein
MRKPDAQGMESGALRVHPGGPVRHQRQLSHQAHAQGRPLVAARIYYGATEVIRFVGRRRVVSFEDGSSATLVLMVYLIFVTTLHFLTPQAR